MNQEEKQKETQDNSTPLADLEVPKADEVEGGATLAEYALLLAHATPTTTTTR